MKKAISLINGEGYKVFFSDEAYSSLHSLIKKGSYSSIFFLVDTHTKVDCLPLFLKHFPELEDTA
ncbi:MAG: hypothetical protein VXW04_03555, partial [Bacteroidota bacterium]|nr:hypothetical protein [Bacteroidota bacterium]